MNLIQRGIITVGLTLMILLAVYPPWILRVEGVTRALKYSTIWEAPEWPNDGELHIYYAIDRDRWIVPLFTVLVATIGLVKVFERKP